MSSAIGDRPLMSAFLCRSAMCSMYPSGLPVDAGKSETASGCGQRVLVAACVKEEERATWEVLGCGGGSLQQVAGDS